MKMASIAEANVSKCCLSIKDLYIKDNENTFHLGSNASFTLTFPGIMENIKALVRLKFFMCLPTLHSSNIHSPET